MSAVKTEAAGDPPEWLATLYGPQQATFSAAKATAVLGWQPRIDLDTAQEQTIAWLIEDGRLPGDGA